MIYIDLPFFLSLMIPHKITVYDVREWVSNYISHKTKYVIIYPCPNVE